MGEDARRLAEQRLGARAPVGNAVKSGDAMQGLTAGIGTAAAGGAQRRTDEEDGSKKEGGSAEVAEPHR